MIDIDSEGVDSMKPAKIPPSKDFDHFSKWHSGWNKNLATLKRKSGNLVDLRGGKGDFLGKAEKNVDQFGQTHAMPTNLMLDNDYIQSEESEINTTKHAKTVTKNRNHSTEKDHAYPRESKWNLGKDTNPNVWERTSSPETIEMAGSCSSWDYPRDKNNCEWPALENVVELSNEDESVRIFPTLIKIDEKRATEDQHCREICSAHGVRVPRLGVIL